MFVVRIASGLKPGFTACRFVKLRIVSVAPIPSSSASATSITTSPARKRPRAALSPVPRPPSLRSSTRSIREAAKAGAMPKSKVVTIAAATVKPSTGAFIATFFRNGSEISVAARARTEPQARSSPIPDATAPISVLSVSSWRTMRPRSAPKALRMATSRCRVPARASNRLATLAHAINSTSATAAARTAMLVSTSRTRKSRIGQTRAPQSPGY